MVKQKLPGYLTQTPNAVKRKFREIRMLEDERIHDAVVHKDSSPWRMQAGVHAFDEDRNRYTNILPFDYNRVKLKVDGCDYINASHVRLGEDQHYVATQGPMPRTVAHFWHMVMQQSKNEDVVVLMVTPLTEGRVKKCFKYWVSEPGQVLELPPVDGFIEWLTLECLESELRGEGIVYTKLKLTSIVGGETMRTRTVHHIHFDQWGDTMSPDNWEPILALSELTRQLNGEGNPMFVHCSAGVGRTGTFITMDHLLHEGLDAEEDIVFESVKKLREQRIAMVQSLEQFEFCYEMLARYAVLTG